MIRDHHKPPASLQTLVDRWRLRASHMEDKSMKRGINQCALDLENYIKDKEKTDGGSQDERD